MDLAVFLSRREQGQMNLAERTVWGELLHHSDRGCQSTNDAYQQTLKTLGSECSMSRTGNGYDPAVAERFLWSLNPEWTKKRGGRQFRCARQE